MNYYPSKDTTLETKQEVSSVNYEIGRLSTVRSKIQDILPALEERLSLILIPSLPMAESALNKDINSCQLAHAIRHEVGELELVLSILDNILNRINV